MLGGSCGARDSDKSCMDQIIAESEQFGADEAIKRKFTPEASPQNDQHGSPG